MLAKTSTTYAPWHILESVDKKYARIKALKIVIKELEKALERVWKIIITNYDAYPSESLFQNAFWNSSIISKIAGQQPAILQYIHAADHLRGGFRDAGIHDFRHALR